MIAQVCYFITIAVPCGVVDAITSRHGAPDMQIEITRNSSAQVIAGAGRTPLLVTGGGCSCGWYSRPRSADIESDQSRALAKYRRLGWSQKKIERALESMRRSPHANDGLHPVIIELLRALTPSCSGLSVWVHDFTGKAEHEHYHAKDHRQCTLTNLPEHARALDIDVVLTVHAQQ